VFAVEHDVLGVEEAFVLKEIHYSHDMDHEQHEYVRVDALVTERLTSNDLVVNIFGYTGFSLIGEMFSDGDIEQDVVGMDERSQYFKPHLSEELVVLNNFTGSEKLKLALSMVRPVAALHNYADGVIVHDDIQLSQFLWTDESKTAMKLNDFNRAEIMFWDDENEEYCKYHNGKGAGDVSCFVFELLCFLRIALVSSTFVHPKWRSPEEYKDEPINEKIDIFSLGTVKWSASTLQYSNLDINSRGRSECRE
jgi:serine/threonine protein kinase